MQIDDLNGTSLKKKTQFSTLEESELERFPPFNASFSYWKDDFVVELQNYVDQLVFPKTDQNFHI